MTIQNFPEKSQESSSNNSWGLGEDNLTYTFNENQKKDITNNTAGNHKKKRGLWGWITSILIAIAKFGVLLLKFLKFGLTFISFAISFVVMAFIFGPLFGLGLLLIIAIHEMGHYLVAQQQNLNVSKPIFLGPLGALITTKKNFESKLQEVFVAGGGLITGLLAAFTCYICGLIFHQGIWYALSYFGATITLFNLIPLSPIDGGRVASGISKWFNVIGIMLLGLVIIYFIINNEFINPLVILILIAGIYNIFHQFKHPETQSFMTTKKQKVWISLGVVILIGLSIWLATNSYLALIAHYPSVEKSFVG